MSDKGVCRTAAATPGLLISIHRRLLPGYYTHLLMYKPGCSQLVTTLPERCTLYILQLKRVSLLKRVVALYLG